MRAPARRALSSSPILVRRDAFSSYSGLAREVLEIAIYLGTSLLVVAVGTLGYYLIEGWGLFDSFYMTVITLASVGYAETHPLSDAGRAFTVILITLGIGFFTALYALIGQKLIQRQFLAAYKGKRMLDDIRRLSQHTIFCGFGRLTRVAAAELRQAQVKLVIIDKDPSRIEEAKEMGFLVLEGDATDDETLLQAGIRRANRLVAVLPKDADNLYVVLTSRELNPELFIMSRAEDESGEKRLRRAGANKVVSPFRVGGQKIAEGLVRPYVTDFLDLAVSSNAGHLQIEEIRIPLESPLAGLTLREAELRQKTNVIVAAIISRAGKMLFNPDADTVIEGGSTFIALGLKDELVELERLLLGEQTFD